MHQSIAAQDRVASGQAIAGDIGEMVFALDLAGGSARLQARDQGRHDIDADDAHAEIGPADPARIATGRIEQRRHAEFPEKPRQFGAQHNGGVQLRAEPGSGCGSTPHVGAVNAPKALREVQIRKGLSVINETLMREHGRTIGIA